MLFYSDTYVISLYISDLSALQLKVLLYMCHYFFENILTNHIVLLNLDKVCLIHALFALDVKIFLLYIVCGVVGC